MLSLLIVGTTISCESNDEELFTTTPTSDLKFTSLPADAYLLTFDTRMNTAERFTWAKVDFSTPVAITYQLQAIAEGGDFENAEIAGSTNQNEIKLTVEELNNLTATLGLAPFQEGFISMRLVASMADVNQPSIISDVITLKVTPYTTDTPKLYVPGNFSEASGYGANYAPGDDNTPFLQAVEFGSTEYEGFVYMNVASPSFKFTPEKTYDLAYGGTSTTLSSSGGDLSLPEAGYYFITVNLDPNEDGNFDDATWSASARSWGIIGAATEPTNAPGWNDELDMTYNKDTKAWTVELNMKADEFKFRAQQWDPATYNFGLKSGGEANELSFGGGNLSITTPGRYKAELNLSQPRNYTYTLTAI